jgi:hypothetical protein
MREGTTSKVMAADRPYGEFCDFYSVSPEYFGETLVLVPIILEHLTKYCYKNNGSKEHILYVIIKNLINTPFECCNTFTVQTIFSNLLFFCCLCNGLTSHPISLKRSLVKIIVAEFIFNLKSSEEYTVMGDAEDVLSPSEKYIL